MKKILIYGLLATIGASFTACDDFLDDNRYPLSKQVVNDEFWNNTVNVENQLNYFYEAFLGYGNGAGYGDFYFNCANDDQAGTVGGEFQDWRVTNVPASSTSWSNPYAYIRRANQVITALSSGSNTIPTADRENYIGIARMMRAYQYYLLVRRYGDVPLVEIALDPSDTDIIYGPRTARNTVMDFALADIDYAIEHISEQANKTKFSKDLARAIKSDICLFEGSYAKYTAGDNTRASKYFTEVVNAATPLLSTYAPGSDYAALYTSLNGTLTSNSEIIFCKTYQMGIFMHSTVDYTSGSTPISGINRDAFESFLFTDGMPLAKTSLNKNDAAPMVDGVLDLTDILSVRDARLAATTYPAVFYQNFPYAAVNTSNMTSTTGYGVKKYNNFEISTSDATTANRAYTDAPLYWGAVVGLNYAEAKAELGTLTDGDLDLTLNKLFARANLPRQTVAGMGAINDPANNMGVSSLLWEIRRCRRCETMMDNDIRYWDLIRWNKLELMDTQKHPKIVQGANITNATVPFANDNGYMNATTELFGSKQRIYDPKYNLYPIPADQRQLNEKLTQNPGW